MNRFHRLIIAALCASPRLVQGDDASSLSQTDLDYFRQAISVTMAEIRLAHIAENRHLTVPLQALADSMVTYRTAALQQLLSLSQDQKAGLADEIQPDDQAIVDDLNGLSDGEVHERYIKVEIEFLKRTIDSSSTELSDGNDIELKEFAANDLAQSRIDLDAARILEAMH